jgi:hypothetical protein
MQTNIDANIDVAIVFFNEWQQYLHNIQYARKQTITNVRCDVIQTSDVQRR